MRTTLTLDDDVASQLKHLSESRRQPLRRAVNEALRAGLAVLLQKRGKRPAPVRINPVSLGKPRVANVDSIADVLALAEGEEHR